MVKFLFAFIVIILCIIAYFKPGMPSKKEVHEGEFVKNYVKEFSLWIYQTKNTTVW